MILVDTSVWVDHLRRGDDGLSALLDQAQVLTHPFVIGELALGDLRERQQMLSLLEHLPAAENATHLEVMQLIGAEQLFGRGIGYVDAHLLAAVRLSPGARLWTRDARLQRVAEAMGLAEPARA